MTSKPWFVYALITTLVWGVWGAFSGISAERGFPDTLVYCVWSLTMIIPAAIVIGMITGMAAVAAVRAAVEEWAADRAAVVHHHAVEVGEVHAVVAKVIASRMSANSI